MQTYVAVGHGVLKLDVAEDMGKVFGSNDSVGNHLVGSS